MTDFRFDLKAVRVKRVLAMFMAVCLTVLSVNVDVFATTPADKIVLSSDNKYGYQGADQGKGKEFELKITELDGKPIAFEKEVDGVNYATPYSGELKVEFGGNSIVVFEKDEVTVSVLNGQINTKIPVTVIANTEPKERTATVGLTFKDVVTGDTLSFTEGKLVAVEVTQEAAPFVPKSASDLKGDLKDDYVTSPNGDVTKYDGTSKSVSEANLADDNYVNGLEYADKEEGIVKVTFYNGIATTKKNVYGTEVAYATRAKGGKMDARAKADTLIALETAYNQGKEFTGYDVHTFSVDKKGKLTISENTVSTNVAYKDIPCDDNYVAVAVYKDKVAENANTTADLSVAVNQTATLQVAVKDYAKNVEDKSVKYTATIKTITPGRDFVYKKTQVSANKALEVSANKAVAAQIIKSVAYNVKKSVFTVKAGKQITGAPAQVVINRVVTKKDKKAAPETTQVATINVTVADTVASPTAINLVGLYGETYANVDYTTNKKQTIKVIATVADSTALTKDVKFVALSSVISTGGKLEYDTSTKSGKADYKAAMAKSKAVKVDANGNITIKGKGTAVVYAYTQTKDGKKYSLVLSNPFVVTVTKSTAKFSVVKDQKFKYNNAVKKTSKQDAVTANAYVVKKASVDKYTLKKTQRVNYSIKGVAKDDFVAVKVLNNEGKVVLGGVTKVMTKKNGQWQPKDFDYQVNLKYGVAYTKDDDLTIVGTAPNGLQKWAKLSFVEPATKK